jgi:hypothetical protein
MEMVDILAPPDFAKTGQVKSKTQAISTVTGSVFSTLDQFNLPGAGLFINNEAQSSRWGPNALRCHRRRLLPSRRNHLDGLREIKEEIGRIIAIKISPTLAKNSSSAGYQRQYVKSSSTFT